jgi:hypothetical protein
MAATRSRSTRSWGRADWRGSEARRRRGGKTVNAQNWQEQFRYALTGAPACNSLRKLLFGSSEDVQAGERSAAKLIGKARSLSHGTWIDALLLAGTHIR